MKNGIIKLLIACVLAASGISLKAQSWEPKAEGLLTKNYGINAIHVMDENNVWAVANDMTVTAITVPSHIPKLLKTTDGGETWIITDIMAAAGTVIFDMHVLGQNTLFLTLDPLHSSTAVAEPGVLRSTDGGQSWELVYQDNSGTRFIHFFNELEGIVINTGYSSHGQPVALTQNGGETWESLPRNKVPLMSGEGFGYLTGGNFLETKGDKIWFGSNAGRIFRSEDKGHNWEVASTPFWEDEDPVLPKPPLCSRMR